MKVEAAFSYSMTLDNLLNEKARLETRIKNQRKEITRLLTEIEMLKEKLAEGKSIIRCRDCKYEYEEWGYPYCCRNAPHSVIEVHGEGFCKWGEPKHES